MALKRFRQAIGTPDGATTAFETPGPYVADSLLVFLNGQQKDPSLDDGSVETDPATGKFDMKEAPLTGDTVWIFYEEA